MARLPPTILIDACVLADFIPSDLLLRLAEDPAVIRLRWSEQILAEVRRTHRKIGWPDGSAASWQVAVRQAFPEALSEPTVEIVARLSNHAKDRHVLGSAIAAGASTIVTYNLKDFRAVALAPWDIVARLPDDFLCRIYADHAEEVRARVMDMAKRHTLPGLLRKLRRSAPNFVAALTKDLGETDESTTRKG
jgi:hypothetical protein